MKMRTKAFAVSVVKFTRCVPRSEEASVIKRQLIRSATAVGANYRAACLARSRADFISKLGIVIEEADESRHWMELLAETDICSKDSAAAIAREAAELTSILIASVKTARPAKKANTQ